MTHPNVQQLLASIWYEGLPGFRCKNMILQFFETVRIAVSFPFLSLMYIMAPTSSYGQTLKKPFIKFICHSASYLTFLGKLLNNIVYRVHLHYGYLDCQILYVLKLDHKIQVWGNDYLLRNSDWLHTWVSNVVEYVPRNWLTFTCSFMI